MPVQLAGIKSISFHNIYTVVYTIEIVVGNFRILIRYLQNFMTAQLMIVKKIKPTNDGGHFNGDDA